MERWSKDPDGGPDPRPARGPGEEDGWQLTLRRSLFPGEPCALRLRILRPVLDELPGWLRGAVADAGAAAARAGDRAAILGDRRAFEALSRDGRAPPDFREALRELLGRSAVRRFEVPLPRGRRLVLGEPPAIFAVLNVTPDSFSDGGRFADPGVARDAAMAMERDGAAVIDVGGESTRPGAAPVSAEEERRRVEPVIRGIRAASDIPISIDTTKAEVARMALGEGADIINDVSALRDDPSMAAVARAGSAPVVLVHRRGTPRDMQDRPRYDDPAREVYQFLEERTRRLAEQGVGPERVMVDPGIGFGKRMADNLALLLATDELRSLGLPVVVGASRKSFLGKVLGGAPVERREAGTLAAHAAAILGGAAAVRVHQVRDHADLIRVLSSIERGGGGGGEE
jgi:dihydropteroate synthase